MYVCMYSTVILTIYMVLGINDDVVQQIDQELNMDTLLIQLTPMMMNQFKLLGQVVGISSDLLDQIESSAANPHDGLVKVCNAWLRNCEDNDVTLTWKHVAEALSLILTLSFRIPL